MTLMRPILLMLPIALAACGSGDVAQNDIDALDAELTEGTSVNGRDPLVASALEDPIMVDPDLAARSNADAVRPPAQPYSAPIPSPDLAPDATPDDRDGLSAPTAKGDCPTCAGARDAVTLAALAARPARAVAGRCAATLRYSAGWAARLPKDLPLHPAARVVEAAGSNDRGCALRIVSFTTARPMASMIDWYYTRAVRAGYSAEHRADDGQHVLGGARARDGGAYMLFLTDRAGGGTDIDLVSNRGI